MQQDSPNTAYIWAIYHSLINSISLLVLQEKWAFSYTNSCDQADFYYTYACRNLVFGLRHFGTPKQYSLSSWPITNGLDNSVYLWLRDIKRCQSEHAPKLVIRRWRKWKFIARYKTGRFSCWYVLVCDFPCLFSGYIECYGFTHWNLWRQKSCMYIIWKGKVFTNSSTLSCWCLRTNVMLMCFIKMIILSL